MNSYVVMLENPLFIEITIKKSNKYVTLFIFVDMKHPEVLLLTLMAAETMTEHPQKLQTIISSFFLHLSCPIHLEII